MAGVRCSNQLQTSVPGVYAAGDICEYESDLHGGAPIRVEHWDVAFNQGKAVALNMLGKDEPYREVPYFFSVLADWGELESVGPAKDWDQEVVRGSMQEGLFTTWYLREGVVKAALTFGRPDDLDHARRLMTQGTRLEEPQRSALGDLGADLAGIARVDRWVTLASTDVGRKGKPVRFRRGPATVTGECPPQHAEMRAATDPPTAGWEGAEGGPGSQETCLRRKPTSPRGKGLAR